MVHTCGGYMVYVDYTFRTAFQYKPGQIYWCTADIGWITGTSALFISVFASHHTVFEGIPAWIWAGFGVLENIWVNIFYTSTSPSVHCKLHRSSWSRNMIYRRCIWQRRKSGPTKEAWQNGITKHRRRKNVPASTRGGKRKQVGL